MLFQFFFLICIDSKQKGRNRKESQNEETVEEFSRSGTVSSSNFCLVKGISSLLQP